MDIEPLRQYCLSMPAATEEIKWGHDLVFSVGGKMFCITSFEPPFTCAFKVHDEDFETLSLKEGWRPAPYLARAKWVQIEDLTACGAAEWKERIQKSYSLIKEKLTKKDRQALGI